nr:AAA family ATPase [Xanthobacter flavus]
MAEPLEVVCAADLAGKPIPPRQEHVEGMIPAGNVTLLYGDGGTGKSLLALQLAVATAAGSQWIGLPVARGSTLCRDAKAEGITKAGFLTAMNNLFAEGRIVNEVFGPPSKPRHRIALKRDNGDASD